ncbi:flagellar protein FlaG [Motilimonas eburnea]|uniref:flagellar protein FlaG n=1 Tax=Motilimonas eburnea TaxID=1737488 RepID=UPI001E645D8C|nr:flagellar protein FlaG [Motilimonas eburnea]MCE2571550.1 flagellar protein FlaG [Motilimonas eburnea]
MKTTELVSSNYNKETLPQAYSSSLGVKDDLPAAATQSSTNENADRLSVSAEARKAAKDSGVETQGNVNQKKEPPTVEEAISLVQEYLDKNQRGVSFSLDASTDRTIIKVMDTKNKELVKQFPSEELLRIANKIMELEKELTDKVGIFLDSEV